MRICADAAVLLKRLEKRVLPRSGEGGEPLSEPATDLVFHGPEGRLKCKAFGVLYRLEG